MVHSNDVESSYQQIAINVVLIIAGKLKSIIPTLSSCFCDCEKSAHWVFTCTSLIILLFCTCSVTIQYNTNKLNVRNVSAEWVWTPREFQTAGAAVQDYDVLFKTSESGGHQQYWAPFQEVRGLAPSYLTSLTPMITTKEMATYRHWSVSLWWDPDDVSHCRILFPDKTECQLISAILCGWRRCLMADSYG